LGTNVGLLLGERIKQLALLFALLAGHYFSNYILCILDMSELINASKLE
tara:strand:- start:1416 stop:1562 length:147 start_codon:yes stop_codon:yes gene_type:complete